MVTTALKQGGNIFLGNLKELLLRMNFTMLWDRKNNRKKARALSLNYFASGTSTEYKTKTSKHK